MKQGKTTVMAAKAFFLALLVAAMAGMSCEGTDLLNTLEKAEEPIRWYSVLSHGTAGQLALEITDDGQFTEPRQALTYRIKVVFPEPLERGAIDEANFDFAGNNGADFDPFFSVSTDMQDDSVVWVLIDSVELDDVALYRIRVKNNDGDVLSERVFGRLEGDVDSDGMVEGGGGDDELELINQLGPINTLDELSIRSDIICDGEIRDFPPDDENALDLKNGNDFTGRTVPSF